MKFITHEYLEKNPNHIFVFGDNTLRRGHGGAAILRSHTNTYGFITKKYPTYSNNAFYRIKEYKKIYDEEMQKLKTEIQNNPDKLYLISKLGGGLANKHNIFESVIEPNIKNDLQEFGNVEFLF